MFVPDALKYFTGIIKCEEQGIKMVVMLYKESKEGRILPRCVSIEKNGKTEVNLKCRHSLKVTTTKYKTKKVRE